MNCSSCGTQIPAGATSCPWCGAAVPQYYSYSGTVSSDPTIPAQPYAAPPQTPSTAYGAQPYGGTPQPPSPYSVPPPPPPYYPYQPPQQILQGPQGPVKRQGNRTAVIVGVVLLVLLLVAGSIFVAVSRLHSSPASTSTTTPTRATTTTPAVTSQSNPYTHTGKLAFSAALGDNSGGHKWDVNGNCVFTSGTYHAIAPNASFSDYCIAQSTDFSNFVFEAQMRIIKGNAGGIIFRVTSTNPANEYYSFYIGQDGSYTLDKADGTSLTNGSNPAINPGLDKTNVIAVVSKGNSFTLYVNHQPIDTITDSAYSHGHIGLIAIVYAKGGQPTEVEFSNVKVWML
jgi:hypothetical protein